MRTIEFRDFLKVAVALFGCLAFFALIIVLEWHRAELAAKAVTVSLFVAFSLLVLRTLFIYRPQDVDLSAIKLIGGPRWSSTIVGIRFIWIDIEQNGVRKRLRLIELVDVRT
jgi:hypothetical protein